MKMKHKNDWLMVLSAFLGFSFFLIANFTEIFIQLNVIAGIIQIVFNGFVFVTWLKGFKESNGFKKFVAAWGVVVPVLLTLITLFGVIIPVIF